MTVVLTSSFSRSEPRPAVTVTGGNCWSPGVCARTSVGPADRPAKAATAAARGNDMSYSFVGRTRRWSDEGRGTSWSVRAVANADRRELVEGRKRPCGRGDALDRHEARRRCREGHGVGKAQAALVLVQCDRHVAARIGARVGRG